MIVYKNPNTKFWIVFVTILSIIYFIVFSKIAHFTNDAFFGGDTWEYQSMGTNFAYGFGIQKFGGLTKFENYKFDKLDEKIINDFNNRAGENDFYRTPAYPLFLGIVYKIFGVEPIIAKYAQLLLISIVAASLPLAGFRLWRQTGLVSGLVASPVYIITNFEFSKYILTESLIIFSIFLLMLSFIYFERNKSTISSVILGIILGFVLLVKGSLIFIPFIIFTLFLFRYYKTRDRALMRRGIIVFTCFIATILPWSIYASTKSNSLIFLSTQESTLLFAYNNEYSLDGCWHPEYISSTNSFYNNDGMENKPSVMRIGNFYLKNPQLFIQIMSQKVVRSLHSFAFLWAYLIGSLLIVLSNLFKKNRATVYKTSIFAIFSLLVLIIISGLNVNSLLYNYYFILFHNTYIVLALLFLGIYSIINSSNDYKLKPPSIFLIISLNFALIMVLFGNDDAVYYSRFIKVIDFIFILLGSHFLINLFFSLKSTKQIKP